MGTAVLLRLLVWLRTLPGIHPALAHANLRILAKKGANLPGWLSVPPENVPVRFPTRLQLKILTVLAVLIPRLAEPHSWFSPLLKILGSLFRDK